MISLSGHQYKEASEVAYTIRGNYNKLAYKSYFHSMCCIMQLYKIWVKKFVAFDTLRKCAESGSLQVASMAGAQLPPRSENRPASSWFPIITT